MRVYNMSKLLKKLIETDKTIIFFLQYKLEVKGLSIRNEGIYIDWRPLESNENNNEMDIRTTLVKTENLKEIIRICLS